MANSYPSWIHRIPGIIEQLALMPEPLVDRQACELLFDLRERAAQHALEKLGAIRIGQTLAIPRVKLMARLRELQENPAWTFRDSARRRIAASIDLARRDSAARSVTISPALANQGHAFDDLPGVTLTASTLTIEHDGPHDLLSKLYALAQAIAADPDRFLEPKPKAASAGR